MREVHIITGFLGAGKTTFINKLLREGAVDGNTVLVENEFGDVSVDSDCLEADIRVLEITSGCICCSLQGNFAEGITELCRRYEPRSILIEPTGLADLNDTVSAVNGVLDKIDGTLCSVITVVGAESFPAMLMAGGDFFRRQVESARCIVMSGTQELSGEELSECRSLLASVNPDAPAHFEPWDELNALEVLEEASAAAPAVTGEQTALPAAWESEALWPRGTYSLSEAEQILAAIAAGEAGDVLRAKGFLAGEDGSLLHLEYVSPDRRNVRPTAYRGEAKFVVIGREVKRGALRGLFRCKYGKI